MLAENLYYFIIAFAIYLLGKSFYFYNSTPSIFLLFDSSIAISLLCSNIPRVLAVPTEYLNSLHKTERFCFGVAIMSLIIILSQY